MRIQAQYPNSLFPHYYYSYEQPYRQQVNFPSSQCCEYDQVPLEGKDPTALLGVSGH